MFVPLGAKNLLKAVIEIAERFQNFNFSNEVSQKFLICAICICERFLRKFLLFAFLFFEIKNLKVGKQGIRLIF